MYMIAGFHWRDLCRRTATPALEQVGYARFFGFLNASVLQRDPFSGERIGTIGR
jgi:hypothetical protein